MKCTDCGTEYKFDKDAHDCETANLSNSAVMPCYVAVLIEQHPLEGGPIPVMKKIDRETTVGEIIDWHNSRHNITKLPVYDLRICEAT
jgi:hypothetical protein